MLAHRVLIVDDDPSWQENFKETVEQLGCVAQLAGNFRGADSRLNRQHFHLVLVDLRLQEGAEDLQGMRLVEKVARLDEGTSTIIISGYADATIATEALKRFDAFYVIEKDRVDPRQFVELVHAAVSQADERYQARFASAMDFLSAGQDVHSWAAEVLSALVGENRTLGLNDLNQLRDLLNVLLDGLFPLLHHRLDLRVLVDRASGVVRGRYWSKALGEAIELKLGSRELVERGIVDAEELAELAAEGGTPRREREHTVGDLGGIVYRLGDASFYDFAF
jgi:ActR/RegA family two-component response regulator